MKLKYLFGALMVACILSGCYDDELQSVMDSQKSVMVTLNLGGEITTSDSPLTRAGAGNDVYGVQVYKDGEPFAHGVFDNVDNLVVNLLAGSNYKFVVSMVKDGKNKLLHDFTYYDKYTGGSVFNQDHKTFTVNSSYLLSNYNIFNNAYDKYDYQTYRQSEDSYNNYWLRGNELTLSVCDIFYAIPIEARYDAFLFPFCYLQKKGEYFWTTKRMVYNHEITNSMIYNGEYDNDFTALNMLDEGYSTMADGTLSNYPEVDRFYGEVDNYTPAEGGALTIDMKRAAFGLKCQVSGISDGSVHVKVANDSRTFFENETITDNTMSADQIFTFASVRDAWLYSDNYTEKLNVTVDWLRGIGVTENLGTVQVSVKRNAMNVIRINLGAVDASSRMSINIEEDSFMDNNNIDVPFVQ